jgi:hypothetical protein
MLDGLVGSLGVAVGAAATVTGAFWKYEDVASPEAKLKVTHWLTYSGSTAKHPEWADHLVVAFNRIFGERHFSLKCFFRSCLASTIATSAVLLFWVVRRPEEFHSFFEMHIARWGESTPVLAVLVLTIILNYIPDYFSYMKTRLILKWIAKSEGTPRLLALAVLDTILSVVIFILGFLLAMYFARFEKGLPGADESLNMLSQILRVHPIGEGRISFGIFFYAALFVSAWSWLYALSALITRFMVRIFPKLLTSTVWFFDVDGHPLRSLGCIAGGVVFFGVLAAKAFA